LLVVFVYKQINMSESQNAVLNIEVFEGFYICPQFNVKQDIDIRDTHYLRVGKNGFDKNASLEEIIEQIVIPNGAHIIVKKSPRSKWYVKRISLNSALEIIANKTSNYVPHPEAKTYVINYNN
jgi:hypothetical protein